MHYFIGEFLGTLFLILLGNGVVSNLLLNKSKGLHGGWVVGSFGWGFAVMVSVYLVGYLSGAHLNPAVSLAFVLTQKMPATLLPIYFAGQFLGAMVGAFLVWIVYYSHFKETAEAHTKLLCFSTAPAIRHLKVNFIVETLATSVLILGIFAILAPENQISLGMNPYIVGLLVTAIGFSLGGPTGYAINPARDLGPRIVYTFLYGRKTADWVYAFVPFFAPFLGSILAVLIHSVFLVCS